MPSRDDPRTERKVYTAYLMHGVAEKKWKLRGRRKLLQDFIEKVSTTIGEKHLQHALINLSSEMSKKCKQNELQ